MAFQTKKSVFAIVEETTEGTLVAPTGGTDFIPIQEGFELSASFNELDNAELTGSIGTAKTTLGFEEPTASFSQYLKHSGVEGQEPSNGLLYEAAFGAKTVNATEYDTVAGATAGDSSSAATIDVDTGEGSNFERGQALLIKDGTNGYSIRCVESISSDTLTLNFNLANAPASGVNLGKAVTYKPGEDHPTLSLWDYRANQAAVQAVAGARVTEMSTEFAAGEFINSSFSLDGIEFFYDPFIVSSSNQYIDFDDGGGEENAAISTGQYKDPHELAAAISTAMNALTTDTITVTYSNSNGKYTIESDGATFELLWSTGANSANTLGDDIGFDTSADDTGATSYEGDDAIDLTAGFTVNFDDSNPLVAKNNHVFLGDFADNTCFSTQSLSFALTDTKADELDICSTSGKSGSVITQREVTVDLTANIQQYDADQFKRFREGEETAFQYGFGTKSGGNWEAGKSGAIYIPTATITSFNVSDTDGLVTLDLSLRAFVKDGQGEVYLNFV